MFSFPRQLWMRHWQRKESLPTFCCDSCLCLVASSFGDVACRMDDTGGANIVPSIYTLRDSVCSISELHSFSNRLLLLQPDAMPSISQQKQATCFEGSGKQKGFASWFENSWSIFKLPSQIKANEVASFRQKISNLPP